METITTVPHGYECAASATDDGWLAAVKVVEDVDGEFLKPFNRLEPAEFHEGKTEEEWSRAFMSAKRRLSLLRMSSGRLEEQTLAEAERIETPTACGGTAPAVAWAERQGDRWRMMLWQDGQLRPIRETRQAIRDPSAAGTGEAVLVAIEIEEDDARRVEVLDAAGNSVFITEGRRPRMAGSPDGTALLVVERPAKERVELAACVILNGAAQSELRVPPAGDFNLNASVTWHPQRGAYYLAWESCPCWGLDERVGLHRDLSLWTLSPRAESFSPAPGTSGGFLRIKPEAFHSGSSQNLTPIRPQVLALDDSVALAFRRFRSTGVYPYGWDTFLMRNSQGVCTEPCRVSPSLGHADVEYSVLSGPDGLVGFFPSCDYEPWQTFEEEAAGTPGCRKDMRVTNQRLEVVRFGAEEGLPAIGTPGTKRSIYVIPPPVHEAAPEPPALPTTPDGRSLIWGDLHAHCAYSKCMGCNDGLPQEVLRFQRDVLGCRVLCLTDHVEYMSGAEFTHVMDCIEREAGDQHLPLYGVEWARYPAHHTNFFAHDREVFERLRTLMFAHHHLTPLYEAIKRELPDGSVVAIRHMHGEDHDEFGTSGARVAETHDPDLEWAMEGMQTRGNMMLVPRGGVLFPHRFLDTGCEIGIIAGSDHSRGGGVNSFCLTGFWVKEPSAAGVFEAIRSRKTFGVASGKIALHATLNGAPAGQRVAAKPPVRIEAHLSCARTLRRVALMRDGEVLPWQEVGARVASVELIDDTVSPGRHWYCVTVEGAEAYPKAPPVAHSSPFFVEMA